MIIFYHHKKSEQKSLKGITAIMIVAILLVSVGPTLTGHSTFFTLSAYAEGKTAADKPIGAEAVWKPADGTIEDMRKGCEQGGQCFVDKMIASGASAAAVNFTKVLLQKEYPFCYMHSFRELGKVDLTQVDCPFMANTMGYALLVNGSPSVVMPGDTQYLKTIHIHKDPRYRSIVRKYPQAELWLDGKFVRLERKRKGGQRFVWKHKLLNGCRACDIAGWATVVYNFDREGNFVEAKLLRLHEK